MTVDGEMGMAATKLRPPALPTRMVPRTRLDTVLSRQQAAAALVPAFKPYAVLEADQVRECFEEIDEEADERKPPTPADPPASAPDAPAPGAA